MSHYRIGVLVGSLRRDSINRKLANAIIGLAPSHFGFQLLRIDDLPPYNQDDDQAPPAAAKRLKQEIRGSDGLLFVTPEYNRSIPGVLKNAIDHASRPYGDSAFPGKPGGVIGASIGAIGTALAQQHLRNVLAYLDVPTLGQPEAFLHVKDDTFEADGALAPSPRKFVQGWVDAYVAWIEAHAGTGKAAG